MKLILLNLLATHVLVDEEDSDIQCFWEQSEFSVDINNPLDQKGSGGIFDVSLHFLQVLVVDHSLLLRLQHVAINLLAEFWDILRVSEIQFIR